MSELRLDRPYLYTLPTAEQREQRMHMLATSEATVGIDIARTRRHIPPPPGDKGLLTPAEAARKLRCSIKTLSGHVASGALRYVDVGLGKKRMRRMFTDADLDNLIANQTRKDVPCPSTKTETVARRTGTLTSKCEVIGFTARRNARRAAKLQK
jgi:Helix-turn-helix domain